MIEIDDRDVYDYVEPNLRHFHNRRLESLNGLRLNNLLRRKNPYLFRSKNMVQAADLIRSLLDAHLTAQEETLFGNFLEGLAVHVAAIVHGGIKSGITGIDLEFSKDGARYIVSIKSGPNWGNASQVSKMREDFKRAAIVIRHGVVRPTVVAVNGCCYGRTSRIDQGDYLKLCGQEFWRLLSDDDEFYLRIIEPIGRDAKRHNDEFAQAYGAVINRFAKEFTEGFCAADGAIDWPKLVSFSSAKSSG